MEAETIQSGSASKKPAIESEISGPSSNWHALQRTLGAEASSSSSKRRNRKKRHIVASSPTAGETVSGSSSKQATSPEVVATERSYNTESKNALRKMVLGQIRYTASQELPGKFVGLDCEMVGVGVDGSESSLARVSVVNFYGAVLMDEFVRQRERVVDYRTEYSGVRPKDLVHAKSFTDVQTRVAELLKGSILVGHALSHDLSALLLSHSRKQTRDTQYYAWRYKVCTSNRVALRNLVQQELHISIQTGEHSSVTDARAAMAIYRLHRKEWETGRPPAQDNVKQEKRKRNVDEEGRKAKRRKWWEALELD